LADSAPAPGTQTRVAQLEQIYADAVDAVDVITTIDSGLFTTYREKDRAAWKLLYAEKRAQLVAGLATLSTEGLSTTDARVVGIMRNSLQSTLPEDPGASSGALGPPSGNCRNASRKDLDASALRKALYSCFGEVGNNLSFEGKPVTRDSAIAMLGQLDDPQRRKALFLAFVPLWESINGKDEPDSPYRRRIKFAAADAAAHGSSSSMSIDAAAKDLALTTDEVEHWLEKILDTWRQVTPDQPVEPWDYRYVAGAADRALASTLSPESMLAMNYAYYRDLGADLKNLGILYDLEPRPGKAPITYTDYVTMGRVENGAWQPTVSRVSASFGQSGLYVLNMLVHENGHAVHYEAIHNRPAFMDIGDDFFCEAFADVTSWNVYDPAWQRKYMVREVSEKVSESAGLRSQYTMVTLEATWALFELRMLRHPEADPNVVWTEITSHYLHIIPHPEYSWWAQRVQLVDAPGFMINYGLGAVVTAELRQHIREQIGPFNTGNPRWYSFVKSNLLQYGTEKETLELLRGFLGRPVSPDALVNDIRRLSLPAPR
jgi:hypothetical protein